MKGKSKILNVFILFALLMAVFGAAPGQAADPTTVSSSTMVFEGTLTNDGDGSYTGTIAMIDENGTAFGDSISGFDVYARNGAQATYDKLGSGSDYACGAVTEHDAYTTGGGWGSQYDPDCADWNHYQLKFEGDHWYLEYYSSGVTRANPMSGSMDWTNMYAAETDAGAYYPGGGTAESAGYALNNTCTGTNGGTASWDMDWSWGSEYVPLAFPGFDVAITGLTGGNYRVILTPVQGTAGVNPPGPVVNQNTGESYGTIQAAIDAASNGDTINVADGTYIITAAITVNKEVTITGNTSNPENVVVKYNPASTSLNGFEIGSANITIQGFKIIDCFRGVHFGRTDVTSTGCTITNCVFDNIHENAIGEVAAENTTISNNTITNCTQQAIEIRANEATSLANRTEVTGNTISSCSQACIQTYLGKYVYIYDNTISSSNDKGINIIRPNATGTADRIQVIGNTISETKWPGIQVIGAPYTYVYDNTLTKCNYYGGDSTGDWDYASIHVQDDGATAGDNVTVDNNTISDGINGIQIRSDNCTVTNNTIYNMGLTYADTKGTAGVGDGVYYNSGIIIGTNWLTNNDKPTGTTITGNDIHDNYHGLYVRDYATLSLGDPSVLSVTAENNWWGDASGPSGEGPGSGDAVSANVDYSPWWANESGTATGTQLAPGEDVQTAITNASSGDVIVLAAGTHTTPGGGYTINTPGITIMLEDGTIVQASSPCFTVIADNTTITSASIGGGKCIPTNGDHGIVVDTAVSNLVIQGLEIDGTGQSTGAGIYINKAITNLQILDNYIHDMDGDGIEYTSNASVSGVHDVEGNLFESNTGNGIDNQTGSSFDVTYNAWDHYDGPASGDGVAGINAGDYTPWNYVGLSMTSSGSHVADKVGEGETITYTIYMDAQSVRGADFDLNFDETKLQVNSVTNSSTFDQNAGCELAYDNVTGVVSFCGERGTSGALTGQDQAVFEVVFQGLDAGTVDLNLDEADDAFAGPSGSASNYIYASLLTDKTVTVFNRTTVTGRIDLQGRADDTGAVMDFAAGSGQGYDPSVFSTSDYWGAISKSEIVYDTYAVTVSMARYLDVTSASGISAVISSDNQVLSTLVLLGGDADDDNSIDIDDAAIIGGQYGNSGAGITNAGADINNDDVVNIFDLALMGGNYNKTSADDYAWTP